MAFVPAMTLMELEEEDEERRQTTMAPGGKKRKSKRRSQREQPSKEAAVIAPDAIEEITAEVVQNLPEDDPFQIHLRPPMTISEIHRAEQRIVCSWASRLALRNAKQKRVAKTTPLFLESSTHEAVLLSLFLSETLKAPRNRHLEKTVQECYRRCGDGDEDKARHERNIAVEELRLLTPVEQEQAIAHLLADTSLPLLHSASILLYTLTKRSDMLPESLRPFYNAGLQKVPSESPGIVSTIVEPELLKDYQTLGSLQPARPRRIPGGGAFLWHQLPVFGSSRVDASGLQACSESKAYCRDNHGSMVELSFASPGAALSFEARYVNRKTGFAPSVPTPDQSEQLSVDLAMIFGESPVVVHTDDLGLVDGRIPGSRDKEFQKRAERQVRHRLREATMDRRRIVQHMSEGTRHVLALHIHGHLTSCILADFYAASKVFQTMLLMRSISLPGNDPSLVLVMTDPFLSTDDLKVAPDKRCPPPAFDGEVTTAYGKAVDATIRKLWKEWTVVHK